MDPRARRTMVGDQFPRGGTARPRPSGLITMASGAWPALARCDRDLGRQDGDVVLMSLGSMPPRDFPEEGGHTLLQRFRSPLADRFQEPGVAKLLAGGVHRLGDAIGVEVQAVSRL